MTGRRLRHFNILSAAGMLLGVWLSAGCAGSKETGDISGKVTYGGESLNGGTVGFVADNGREIKTAQITAEGTYKVAKVPVGQAAITVVTPPPDTEEQLGKDKSDAKAKVKPATPGIDIPKKYSKPSLSGLSYEVKKGSQTHDIELPD
jgi:hypothetical protein